MDVTTLRMIGLAFITVGFAVLIYLMPRIFGVTASAPPSSGPAPGPAGPDTPPSGGPSAKG
jgi:hypothetical protein